MSTLALGTRGSELALFQAKAVAALLHARAGVDCQIVVVKTSGDRLAEATLAEIGGKRLFVKELEEALIAGTIDLAVHSSKDMPALVPPELAIAGVLPREDPRDAVVLPNAAGLALTVEAIAQRLGQGPRIATSSVRRTAQLGRLFPNARFVPVRGNLDTRLKKLDAGQFDALVLAAAGLKRLDRESRIAAALPVDACVPAPGQGIIAVQARSVDAPVRDLIAAIDNPASAAALAAERAVVIRLGGGCQMPIGAFASTEGGRLSIETIVLTRDGHRAVRAAASGTVSEAERIGTEAAEKLLAQGAAEILAEATNAPAAVEGLQP
jgi:hydroxymethylbilane synthase